MVKKRYILILPSLVLAAAVLWDFTYRRPHPENPVDVKRFRADDFADQVAALPSWPTLPSQVTSEWRQSYIQMANKFVALTENQRLEVLDLASFELAGIDNYNGPRMLSEVQWLLLIRLVFVVEKGSPDLSHQTQLFINNSSAKLPDGSFNDRWPWVLGDEVKLVAGVSDSVSVPRYNPAADYVTLRRKYSMTAPASARR